MVTRIIIGLIITAVGVTMVFKTPWFLQMLGRLYWAEKNLGAGGTRLFYKLIGVALALLGIVVVTDLWEQLVSWILAPLFGLN